MKHNKTQILLLLLLFGAFCFGGGVFYGQHMLTEKGFVYEGLQTETGEEIQLNINTAAAEELETLNGIGEITAEKIVTSREEDGDFATVEELKERGIVGESKFAEIAPYLTVE